ncbi:MAG TPA: hypothetical protein PKL68_03175 [Actinomycetota bacterium]|nr:hypothetical protein [Actinomycetota bacterium]
MTQLREVVTVPTVRRPSDVVSQSAIGMAAGRAASMALGFLFWLAAARFFTPVVVGATAGLVSSMMLCTQFAQFGIGNALITELPRNRGQERYFVTVALWWTVIAALAVAVVFLGLGATVLRQAGGSVASPVAGFAFLIMCVLGTANIVMDQTSMALGRGAQVLIRNLSFGAVAALGLLGIRAITAAPRPVSLLWAWVAAGVAACVIGLWQFHVTLPPASGGHMNHRHASARIWGTGLANQALTLAERAPTLVLPIVVVQVLGARANAAWYPAWMIAWGLYIIPMSVGMALFSGVADERRIRRSAVASATRTSLLIGGAAAIGVIAAAHLLLSVLGKGYATDGTDVVRLLALGVFPLTATQMYFGVCRGTDRIWEATGVAAISGIAGVAAATILGADRGLIGFAWGWFAAVAASGIWSTVRLTVLMER